MGRHENLRQPDEGTSPPGAPQRKRILLRPGPVLRMQRCKLVVSTMHSIRPATPADVPLILNLIRALAEYEREPDAVKTTEADLMRDGFGESPCFECLIAESGSGEPAGFALYFYNYSTWRGRAGIHLEDLFG